MGVGQGERRGTEGKKNGKRKERILGKDEKESGEEKTRNEEKLK